MVRFLSVISILLSACAAEQQFTADAPRGLTFIHLNDTYRIGAVEDGNRGGFGRVATIVRDLQAQGRDVRILHGGDFLYPSLESRLWDGLQMVEAFNFLDDLAPMYLTAGNHEFDRRAPEALAAAVRASRFDWLGDNYRFVTGEAAVDSALQSEFTFDHDGRTVGIFALTLHADDGGNERDYLEVDPDYPGVARRVIEAFEARGVDLIIGVTHLHMQTDAQLAGLKAAHPDLALIVGGHEHEPEHLAPTATNAEVMVGASNARVIWRVDVDFDAGGQAMVETRKIPVDASIEVDPEYAAIYAARREQLLERYPFLESQVGAAAVPLDGREQFIRNGETGWGNFVADQMLGAFGKPPADLAFVNSGTLRIDDIIEGDIVFEDIARTFGFSSQLRYLPVSGDEFRALLEAGYRGEGPSKGYFPQVAGFRVCVDRGRPEFERIVSLQLPGADGWSEIEAERDYSLVMPDYLFRGGDGYAVPGPRRSSASRPGSELVYRVLDAILEATASGEAIGAAVDPANPRYAEPGRGSQYCWPRNQ